MVIDPIIILQQLWIQGPYPARSWLSYFIQIIFLFIKPYSIFFSFICLFILFYWKPVYFSPDWTIIFNDNTLLYPFYFISFMLFQKANIFRLLYFISFIYLLHNYIFYYSLCLVFICRCLLCIFPPHSSIYYYSIGQELLVVDKNFSS